MVTIIILIILATVAINFAFGSNGLIRRAEDARDYYSNDTAYTDQSMANVESYLDELISGVGGGTGSGTTTEDGVPIPDGFYYVGGTKEEGVVISDAPEDAGKGTSHSVAESELVGNQFVWIPVEDDSLFERYAGYSNGNPQSITDYTEPYENGYGDEETEYNAMKASVLDNNGFYVGRYEAGTTAEEARTESSGINVEEVVVQQGKNVYNYVGWNNSETDAMNDETGGAVELAKRFAEENGYESVTSTLIYGVQWDAIMNFIDSNYATGSCDASSFVRDSSGKGWYNQSSPTITGLNANYAIKNIYDLGGNVQEWTMEAVEGEDYALRARRGRQLPLFWLGFSIHWSWR